MRYSASWLSVCWAATVCCPSWLVWICWAGPDGLLKALPYGIPETLHSLHRHTQTSNCYSCYCDFHHHCCYSYASFSLTMSHIVVLLRSKNFNWFRRLVLPSFQRYCLCPTRCLVITVLHAFSGLSVLFFFSNGICAIEAECSLLNTKWCSAITSSWSVGTNCLYPQTMWKMQRRIGLYHSLHLKFQQYLAVLKTLESCCLSLAGPESQSWGSTGRLSSSIFLTHAVVALTSCISNHQWLVYIMHKILLLSDLLLVLSSYEHSYS